MSGESLASYCVSDKEQQMKKRLIQSRFLGLYCWPGNYKVAGRTKGDQDGMHVSVIEFDKAMNLIVRSTSRECASQMLAKVKRPCGNEESCYIC